MKPTRVAMLLPGLGRVQRGAETAFLEVAYALDSYEDMDVQLFGSSQHVPHGLRITAVECTPREKFERWPKIPTLRNECYYEEFSFVTRLARSAKFRAQNFDVTISCTYPWINWYLRYSKRRNRNLKNIFVTQNGDRMCHIGHREYRYFTCDGLVTINPEYYETNKKLYPTVLIPNGTDPEVFYPPTTSSKLTDIDFEFPKDKTVVLMASAMIESKRVVEGLRSAAQVEDAYFVVAGDGPKRAEIAELAESLMPGRHRLLGSIPATHMPQLFRQADVFLHMSQEEPFGIVYLEAAASGLPIVTHHGATPKWILGDTAVFADTNDFEQVAQAIRLVMDPAERERLGNAARDRVMEDWTWKAQAAKYRKFIHSLTNVEAPVNQEEPHAFDNHRQLQHA